MDAIARLSLKVIAAAAANHLRAVCLLLVLALACFLPGFASMQPMDRDEPRFAQASKQMLESQDFVDIRFQSEARHKKPVGIYWLQTVAVSAGEALGVADARRQIWLYRIPSLIGAVLTVLLTYWAALMLLDRRGALAAGMLMATAILLGVEARLAKTDAMMAASGVLVFAIVARAWILRHTSGINPMESLLFWAAIGFSVLLKGPVIALFALVAMLVLSIKDRSPTWLSGLRDKRGIGLALVIVLPWFIAIAWKSGGSFFADSVGKDMLAKVGSGQEKHWAPPGAYATIFFATFWPGSALVLASLAYAWRNRRDDVVALCLAWVVPSWLILEAIPTKLPHYVLPLLPALAILAVKALQDGGAAATRWGGTAASLVLPLVPLALFGLGLGGMWFFDRIPPLVGAPILFLAATVAVFAWLLWLRVPGLAVVPLTALAAVIASFGAFKHVWPEVQAFRLSPRLAAAAEAANCASPALATVGYREPSLVFLTSTDLVMTYGIAAAQFLKEPGCRIVFVERRHEAEFQGELSKLGIAPRLITRVAGFNLNGGRFVDIAVHVSDNTKP